MIIITNKEEQIISIPKSRQTVVTQSGVYTKNQVDALLDLKQDILKSGSTIKTINGESILGSGNIKINVDLSDYYTKEQVDEKIGEIEVDVPEKTSELTNDSGFITLEDVKPLIPIIPTKVSTFQNDAGYLTEHQDISGLATIAELQSVESRIPIVPTNVSAFVNDAGYLTKHQSLAGYATENWVNNQNFAKASQIPTDYVTNNQLNNAISGVETKIPSLDGYAKESWVNQQGFAKASDIPDLDGYATEQWVNSKGYLTEHQPLKTINGESIVGEGNIVIQGGGGGSVDTEMSDESENAVQNKVIKNYVDTQVGYIDEALDVIIG